jgi:membrane-associated phospholipid phosphatase
VKDSSPLSVFAETWADVRTLLRSIWTLARRHYGWGLAAIVLCIVVVFVCRPHDRAWLSAVQLFRGHAETTAHGIAWQLGRWGDYQTYNLPVAILIWIYGTVTGSRAWRRVAIVCFLGASLAGLFDDCFRLTMGRPRPDVYPAVPDGFYGPAKALFGRYESFPSGHAASDMGMGVALLLVCRPLGVLATAFALAVVWGRMELNKHFPSDVIVGSIVGIYWGVVIGLAGTQLRAGSPERAARR